MELARLYCSDDIGLPSIGNRIQDFADVVSYIRKNKQFNKLKSTKTRTSILKRTASELDAHLIALSPSDASVNFALTQASKFLDKSNTSRGFYTTSEENFNSVCLHMKFNDINVILGSDFEEKEGKDDVGWSAILTDNIFTDLELKPGQV